MMTKYHDVSSALVGARFTPDTIEQLVEAKLEDLGVVVGGDFFADGLALDTTKFKRTDDMAHAGSSQDDLGKLLAEIFPGVHLTDTRFAAKSGERDQLQLTIVGNMGIFLNPEASMDPDILRILHAKRSAQEMRNDDGK